MTHTIQKEERVRIDHKFRNDQIIRSYNCRIAKIHTVAQIDHAIVSEGNIKIVYGDFWEKELQRLQQELNQYLQIHYSDLLNRCQS